MSGLLERAARALTKPGLLDRLERPIVNLELGPEWSVGNVPTGIMALLGGDSATGMRVAQDPTVMRVAAVYSCVQLLAGTMSTLPLVTYRKDEKGNRVPAEDHPLFELLGRLSNVETSACTLRETQGAHLLLRGNAYVRQLRDGAGGLRELVTLQPGYLTVERPKPDALLEYRYAEPGMKVERLPFDAVWRVPGLSWNGLTGLSPIALCREVVGLAMALEENTARAMKNGARIAGVLMAPGEVEPVEKTNVKGSFDEAYGSVENAGKIALLEAGWKFEKVGMTFEDLQFLELKKFQLAEIARLFRCPLHMLFDDKAQPRANMEQAGLEFVVYSLRPWLVRVEQSAYRDLLLPSERGTLYVEHNVNALLRGDMASRFEAYAKGRQWGWYSVNRILELENENGIGPEGDVYLQPGNMVTAGKQTPAEEELLAPVKAELARIREEHRQDRLAGLIDAGLSGAAGEGRGRASPVTIMNVHPGATVAPHVEAPAPVVNVQVPPQPAPVVNVQVPPPARRTVVKRILRDASGNITGVEETETGAET